MKQSNFQFLRKFLRWAVVDLRRFFHPIPYSEVKGPNYYRPLGYDDRPIIQKLLCKYFWIRTVDHIRCGIVTWRYDNHVYFHERYPNWIKSVEGPLEIYLPKKPKRFPNEFIQSELARMKRLHLPPSEVYEEFGRSQNVEEHDDELSWKSLGSMVQGRFAKLSKDTLSRVGQRGAAFKENDAKRLANEASQKVNSLVSEHLKDSLNPLLGHGQDLAKLAAQGDVKGIATNVKDVFRKQVIENENLKSAAHEKSSAFQEVVAAFVSGYHDGKKYEEINQTDPRDLISNMQGNVRKAVFVAARDVPGVMDEGVGGVREKFSKIASEMQNLDNVQVSAEEEKQIRESVERWVSERGKSVSVSTEQLLEEFYNTPEGKILKVKAEQSERAAKEMVSKANFQIKQEAQSMQSQIKERLDKLK